jgi:DNA-binding CsgD family transcriptional regulator
MTDRWPATYGSRTITSQPNTLSKKATRKTVSLTPAETRVLSLLPTYRTLAAIGTELDIGRPTVKTHVENIYKKLGATKRAEAVELAETAGLLPARDRWPLPNRAA